MSLPPFDSATGLLPIGEHIASWHDILDRFGWNATRRRQLDGLADALALLAEAGCTRVWLNGSFVTAKDEPGDFDAVWDPTGVDTDVLDGIFFELANERQQQKAMFGGELFPNWTERGSSLTFSEFFQLDRVHGTKGIVVIDPRSITS